MFWMLTVYLVVCCLSNLTFGANHSVGYCNTFNNCGKKSIFGKPLPCANFVEAREPSLESKNKLRAICGQDFDLVCCSPEQIEELESNLKRVDAIISSCPACHRNFYNFFCQFSCSPNESTFVEILKTQVAKDTGKEIVTEINQYVDPKSAKQFYDSCKDVKFSATNGFAMDLIGGGAKNFSQFLKFLGDEKPFLGGSPYQINFKYNLTEQEKQSGLRLRKDKMYACNDKEYNCACTDCEKSCPKLPHAKNLKKKCTVGIIPCFSFAVLTVLICLILLLGGYHLHLANAKKYSGQRHGSYHSNIDDDDEMINPLAFVTVRKPAIRQCSDKLNSYIQNSFEKLGKFCSTFPGFTIGTSLTIAILLSLGMFKLKLETNPVNLWVSPKEPAYINQQYFESQFGEWFRVEQVIVSSKSNEPIFKWDTISWWFQQEQIFQTLNKDVSLTDICFKPLGETCAIESFTQYFHGDINEINEYNWRSKLQECANSPVNCLPTFQQPLKPQLLFDNVDISKATAFTVTLLINSNSTDERLTTKTVSYEHSFQNWARSLQQNDLGLNIAYSTEVSLTEELNQSSNTDIRIIVISYLAMFIYASLALGGKLPNASIMSVVKTRFMLGLGGIVIILLAVTSSVGLFSLVGLKSTLIIAEVIPFLILAIGVDNIFLIVHELHKITEHEPDLDLTLRIAFSMRNIGPSCFISAVLQISMLLLASAVDMPAVKNFAIYSACSVGINFLLQMTCFIGLLALDQRRMESGRVDCAPWITLSPIRLDDGVDDGNGNGNSNDNSNGNGNRNGDSNGDDDDHIKGEKHLEYNFSSWISNKYAPYILGRTVRPKILTFFILWSGISLSFFPEIQFGLDQRIALPKGSYLIDYFNSVYNYFNTGPPVFFVVKDLDVRKREHQQEICGKFAACNKYSVANILEQEFKRSKKSTIAEPSSNWLDDFLSWLNPDLDQCCRFRKSSLVFEHPPEFCSPNAPERQCQACYADHDPPYDPSMQGFPQDKEFMFYFNQWIEEPSDPCPLGGKAPYSTSISRSNSSIKASYFRTAHTPLRSQDDFIVAYKNSKRIVDEIKRFIPNLNIFSWSPFYIFFVQYQHLVSLTFWLLSAAIGIIWLVCTILLGSMRSSTIMTVTIISIMINIGGVLALWGISLNAVSLVNLIICCGLAVEFTIHLTRAYTVSKVSIFENENDECIYNTFINYIGINSSLSSSSASIEEFNSKLRYAKAFKALATVGGSIIGGITITKIIGISILAFTRSKIFEVYYFRMWFALIVISALHALILLPVLLSYSGDLNKSNSIVYDASQLSGRLGGDINHDENYLDDNSNSES
ncbi:NCR1 [Candida oxycetoniae]|uniref:NCR1 n=1 Tax=Candida oxycetoniae TaxID=497107 RepID=A0AAI9SUD3_9ASCO|nr:NCR1 [Candida oxycetoniae]KAI3403231.2 NCR1 [Candida oxycetoniae]